MPSLVEIADEISRNHISMLLRRTLSTVFPGETYLHNWHIDAIVHVLQRVENGKSKRLIINQPPRSLKSLCVSVAYVAWLLGKDPSTQIMVVSYSADLAAELHRQFRLVIESYWFKRAFPHVRWEKITSVECITTKGGGRYATSVGGTLTGRGAELIIIDDPLNAADAQSDSARQKVIDWFSGSLVSRLNDKRTGSIILVMQRLHENDLTGHLVEQDGWDRLTLQAIATDHQTIAIGDGDTHTLAPGDLLHPEREDQKTLDRLKQDLGSLLFSAQYQQEPVPLEGNIIKKDWFNRYDTLPERPNTTIVQSWDIAGTTNPNSDWSVCTTWLIDQRTYYLVSVYRERLEYPDLRRKVIMLARSHGANTILIENAGLGLNLLQDLRADNGLDIPLPIGIKPQGSKADRLVSQTSQIEAGHVWLPHEAPWVNTLLHELLGFPNQRYDDQVDSLSQFLAWAQKSALNRQSIGGAISVPLYE